MDVPETLSNWQVGLFWLQGIKTVMSFTSFSSTSHKLPLLEGFATEPAHRPVLGNTALRTSGIHQSSQGKLIMRCLFSHKWVTSWEKTFVRSLVPYRRCQRCGIMQRGTYDSLTRDVAWESMRERTYIAAQQVRIVRQPASGLDQLAHRLGLRRSRMSDNRAGSRDIAR